MTLACSALAAEHKDDVNRNDTEWTSVGGVLDAASDSLTISRGKFRILSGVLATDPECEQEKEIVIEHLQPPPRDGGKSMASVDFMLPDLVTGFAVGMAFNHKTEEPPQGLRKQRLVRIRGDGSAQCMQFFEAASAAKTLTRNFTIHPGEWYTPTLRCEGYPALEYTLGFVAVEVTSISSVAVCARLFAEPLGGVGRLVDARQEGRFHADKHGIISGWAPEGTPRTSPAKLSGALDLEVGACGRWWGLLGGLINLRTHQVPKPLVENEALHRNLGPAAV